MKSILAILTFIFSHTLMANPQLPQSPDADTLKQMALHNQEMAKFEPVISEFDRASDVRPFAEYHNTGYIFFNDDDYRGYAREIKETIARKIPADVTLVVYSTSSNKSYLGQLKSKYTQYIDPARLVILQIPPSGSNNFWTRDNLPLPVWTDDNFTLVDARYYYNFEPDSFLTSLFASLSTKHDYFFEGGNFTANARGECIVVNRRRSYPGGISDTAAIPDSVFRNQYGCNKLIRFKHLKGIGHSDEVVKFMTDDIVVTDTHEYVAELEEAGYEVHMLPEPDRRFETYVNSLQVNDVLFVPVFGESGDSKAIEVYESLNLGLEIVPINTRNLATRGQGGIHCITMNYPPAPLAQIVRSVGGTFIQ